ncbi:MAG: DNA polymerase I [Limnochordia bacterium]|nr:DNA polymerase I [Limnochordia bacterium]MDD2629836.1 DNA polymerase I [Limnochordia bacterium]
MDEARPKKSFMLIDGHSLIHRAFYAIPLLTNAKGEPTNAVLGFTRMLWRLLDEYKPGAIAVAFDHHGPTFRHEAYEDYKANRKATPEELRPQIGLAKEVVAGFGIPILEVSGFEGDDLIGTAAKRASKQDFEVFLVTGDKDCLQLVNDSVKALLTRRGITDMELLDSEGVKEKLGVLPVQVADLKGLMGDPSDNIPGVPGIGEKTAVKLLNQYANIDEIIAHREELSPRVRKNLAEHEDLARLSKELATIDTDAPFELDPQECCWQGEPDYDRLRELFIRLDFNVLLDLLPQQEESAQTTLFSSPAVPSLEVLMTEQDKSKAAARLEGAEELFLDLLWQERPGRGIWDSYVGGVSFAIANQIFFCPLTGQGSLSEQLGPLTEVLEEGNTKYCHDLKSILLILKEHDILLKGDLRDLMVAGYLCNPGENNYGLLQLGTRFCDVYHSPLKDCLWELSPSSLAELAQLRMSIIPPLARRLKQELERLEMTNLFLEMEMPLIEVLQAMERAGICLDVDFLNELSEQMDRLLFDLSEAIYMLAGERFNLNSPKQLAEILFDRLGLPVVKKTKTGPSTSHEVLVELAEHHEIARFLVEYRKLAKLKSTYVDALPQLVDAKTGRLHTSYNQVVTATGRLSSTNPNLQNIPVRTEEGRKIRRAFVPQSQDRVFLSADYSQIELRILAHVSGDQTLINAFEQQQDIHKRTAAEIFEVPLDAVTDEMRNQAKAINFGIIYGISSFGLSRNTGLDRRDAQEFIDRYFAKYPGVKDYLDKTVQEAKRKGYVRTIFGRLRFLEGINSRNYTTRSFAERMAMNTPIQGSAADIIKLAMVRLHGALKSSSLQGDMLLQVHDELVFDVAKSDLHELAVLVTKVMEHVYPLAVPLKVELNVGPNWADTKPYTI